MEPKNSLRLDNVSLNIPGIQDYDPSNPWVRKIYSFTEKLSDLLLAYMMIYVEDIHQGRSAS